MPKCHHAARHAYDVMKNATRRAGALTPRTPRRVSSSFGQVSERERVSGAECVGFWGRFSVLESDRRHSSSLRDPAVGFGDSHRIGGIGHPLCRPPPCRSAEGRHEYDPRRAQPRHAEGNCEPRTSGAVGVSHPEPERGVGNRAVPGDAPTPHPQPALVDTPKAGRAPCARRFTPWLRFPSAYGAELPQSSFNELGGGFSRPLKPSTPAADMEHTYLASGWCTCGHHRDDGRRDRDDFTRPTIDEIRTILGPTYHPKDTTT